MATYEQETTETPNNGWLEKFPDGVDLPSLLTEPTWRDLFDQEMEEDYFGVIEDMLEDRIAKINTKPNYDIYPYPNLVFNAFNLCSLDQVKVVILGQDPYINAHQIGGQKVPQAMGLAFSVPTGVPIPPSLKNIYKVLHKFNNIDTIPSSGNLTNWVNQGCLLLNTSLTVRAKKSNGHSRYWTTFTDAVSEYISDRCDHVVFMLWGNHAKSKCRMINQRKHKVLTSSHPSPLGANSGSEPFMENDHFTKCNNYLVRYGKEPIDWHVE